MLVSLHVKNLALIDETEVNFGEHLNILTGETGAGKSVIIGSITLALGAKADKDIIRAGAEYALVELVFQIRNEKQKKKIQELDIVLEEDDCLIISRRIQPTRSVSRINGETVSAKQLRELAEILIDIHGQYEHQSLLQKKKHKEVLDGYAGETLQKLKTEINREYHSYKTLQKEFDESAMDERDRQREMDLATFEIQEIENARLVPEEEEQLENGYRKMVNFRKIAEAVSGAYALIGSDNADSAVNQTGRALRDIRQISNLDEELQNLEAMLADVDSLLSDANRSLSEYLDSLEFDEESFHETEDRLNLLNSLKNKYGNSVDEILRYQTEKQQVLEKYADYDTYRKQLEVKIQDSYQKLCTLCEKTSAVRSKNAGILAKQMKEALIDLNFLDVQFEIQVRPNPDNITAEGYDEVEFMISTNPGEPIRPLTDVASGGELSRIMLALKTVLADKDEIESLIFDEIDSGISGKTAWKVSEKMGELGRKHQIICITHLPQIAAMADTHFLIEKKVDGKRTATVIVELETAESDKELARMLGGEVITETVLQNAREMKEMALKVK
ncbi:MAG: DNA repair protein RecN [Lachnospiraceae bacterium]|nr:DNA repair protein RecN [Lachnospiraceae bacterium]